jgi:uncharacterized protein (TIGR00369 family)
MPHHLFLDKYSNTSKLLGMKITLADNKEGKLEADFLATEQFNNTAGNVQGGIITAMLDDVMGYALGITLPLDVFAPTANLNISFLRPVKVGRLSAIGQVLKRDGEVFHLAGKLYNEQGELVASATAKAKSMPIKEL